MDLRKTSPLILFLLCCLFFPAGNLEAATRDIAKPGPKDTCPVCGMFVALYPEWIATVEYKDGAAHHFDGAKDLFKYLLDMKKWAPGRNKKEISSIRVTEYYSVARIDGQKAFYVIGSDVLGPMGHELIPLASREDAEEFLKDHKGKRIMTFDEVNLPLLTDLDHGKFE